MKIGIVGTGRMGTGIAQRLMDLGHDVLVWNRSAHKAHDAYAAGATWTPLLRDLVRETEVVISFLYDNSAVERVYLGPNGILANRVAGCLFIDMSTVGSQLPQRIGAAMAAAGATILECPVSGSVPAARSGTLVGFAGGTEQAFARALPLLKQFCRRVEHVGPLGSGARMKLSANLLLGVFWQALGEALTLAGPSTLGPERIIDLLADSNISAGILRARQPQIVAALQGQVPATAAFDVDTLRKDMQYMLVEAGIAGHTLPLTRRALECFDRVSGDGNGSIDSVAYPALWLAQQEVPQDMGRGATAPSPRSMAGA